MAGVSEKIPELLAPAGTVKVFETAIAAGADAVYVGAPLFNARALARNFGWPEIAAMIDYGHNNNVKVYAAMNSLMKESEIFQAVETLSLLETLDIDAVIIQDLGIYNLARKFFPKLRLHASTLMNAHNSLAVRQFAGMGFSRVVLARELTLNEIKKAGEENPGVELEVFVHGALCFSYSGTCLFSSSLGGKSGLRGRCVQPCRRRYTWQGKGKGPASGYFFSMNDLQALEVLPRLIEAGVSSFKIEGRMRSTQYVASVVRAYRLLLDNPGDRHAGQEAKELLGQAMGRKATTGYFLGAQPREIIAPQHSGNIGIFLGKVEKNNASRICMTLKGPVKIGDRLRIHHEKSGERASFTLKKIWVGRKEVDQAPSENPVCIGSPVAVAPGDSLYKVDFGECDIINVRQKSIEPLRFKKVEALLDRKRLKAIFGKIHTASAIKKNDIATGQRSPVAGKKLLRGRRGGYIFRKHERGHAGMPLWVRVDDFKTLRYLQSSMLARLIISLDQNTYRQFFRFRKYLKPYLRNIVWGLPPVIDEENILFYEEAVSQLFKKGFKCWQIGHVSQLRLFAGRQCVIFGDYTLNVLNSQALNALHELGVKDTQVLVETDRKNLRDICGTKGREKLGLMIYGRPALFTARLAPVFFQFGRKFVSPKGEKFVLQKKMGMTVALSEKYFSLLPWLNDLASAGLNYGVIDLSGGLPRAGCLELLLESIGKPLKSTQNSFNYQTSLQ